MPDYSKLAKGLTSLVKGADDVAPAVNRLDMNFKDVTKRIPELTDAANMVARGEMTAGQYDSLVRKLKPVTPYDFVPQPATADDAMRALTENKRPMFGRTNEMARGEQADLRLDIPAYKDHGVWVNSIHRKDQPTVYGSTSSVKNATMIGAPDKALKVAQGGPKAPFAVIRGEWNPMDEGKAVKNAQKYLNHPDWKQVGYDPERHGFFYDRATMAPVIGADEVIQIGPLVLAKKPKYGKTEDFPFKKGGGAHMKTKQGAVRMQVGGLSALAKLGKAGTTLSKAEIAALRARGMGVPGVDFADPLKMPNMRMSEALGNAGAEGKFLNFTEADRSRVFGNNMGGTGFSALQHYSVPHKQANTVWGFGNKSTAEKKIRQNDPDNTIWTTYAGSPEQHKSNTVVVKDAVKTLQDANAKGAVHPEQVRLINERIRQATSDKGAPLFPPDFDITDPQALSLATTFDRRTAISDALMGTGVKKPMISKEFKAANPGVQWNDASDISRILTRETDPVLAGANTFDVGPHFFTMDNKIIHRPDLNEAFPVQVTGTDLGLRYKPAPFRNAAPDFIKEKGYGPTDPINAWALSRGNPRQFVDEKYLTGLQKEGHKDGGSVTPSFTQRLESSLKGFAVGGEVSDNTTPDMNDGGNVNYGGQYAHGGKVHMPIRSLRQVKPRRYAEAGYVDPLSAPDYQTGPQDKRMVELAGRMIRDQASKEGAVLSTPEGRRDIALKVASHMPGLGMGGDLVALADWVQSLIPGLNKPASVLDTKGEGDKVAKYPLRNVISAPTGEEFQDKFREMGIQGNNEAPVTEFIGSLFTPAAVAKIPKAARGVEGGLNSVTVAARRPFTPATVTTEAVAPDLAKFKGRPFQDFATKQMIGEGAAVPMTRMGGQKTTQRPGQGVYLNEAGQLELNPMVGIDVPRAGNLSTNRALRGDIATAGQELNQEAMAAHRFVPMATNNIKDASSMMITGPGGRALTNEEVIELGKRLPGMIVSHSPRSGGLFVAPYSVERGRIPTEFLEAQSAANSVLGKGAKIQFGKSDPNKDLMYMMRQDYATEGGRGTSAGAQGVREKLKRMDKTIPAAR